MNKIQKIVIAAGITGAGVGAIVGIYKSKMDETDKRLEQRAKIDEISKELEQHAKVRKLIKEFVKYSGSDKVVMKGYTDAIRKEANKYTELLNK